MCMEKRDGLGGLKLESRSSLVCSMQKRAGPLPLPCRTLLHTLRSSNATLFMQPANPVCRRRLAASLKFRLKKKRGEREREKKNRERRERSWNIPLAADDDLDENR